MLFYVILYCIVLYYMISYHIILYYIMLCYVILYYIILYYIIYTVKLGWGFVKPIARKTNEMFRSFRYSLHAEGGSLCMQHPGPRNGAAILEAFPSSGNSAARFWGRFLAPFLGPRKSKQELLDSPDGPDFVHLLAPAFLLQCKPPWTHTSV